MNGFTDHGLDESAFGEKKGFSEGIRSFDAFRKTRPAHLLPDEILLLTSILHLLICMPNPPMTVSVLSAPADITTTTAKTKPTYTRRTPTGGYTTLFLIAISVLLSFTELRRWYSGHEAHLFSVEKGVSHELQINLDIVVPMLCSDLHINVQDASGDRILAGDMLRRDATTWTRWTGSHKLESGEMVKEQEEDTHVGHVLGEVRSQKRKFKKTPRVKRGEVADSCRIFGSLEGNKVQGDFHITARGHGYMEFGQHLDHSGTSPHVLYS